MYLSLLSIALGSVLGAWLRWGISLKFNSVFEHIPFGTFIVNLVGAKRERVLGRRRGRNCDIIIRDRALLYVAQKERDEAV